MTGGARELALSVLLRCEKDGGYSNLALPAALAKSGLSPADRSLATELVYGTLERQITLDHYLSALSSRPLSDMFPDVRNALRLGAYQLLFLDRIPDSAACDESVELVKRRRGPKTAGFVNAVLRSLIRRRGELEKPDPVKDPEAYLSVEYAVTRQLAGHFLRNYGFDTASKILAAFLSRRPSALFVNTLRTTRESLREALFAAGIEAGEGPVDTALLLPSGAGDVTRLPGFPEGHFFVQDAASQLCCRVLAPKHGERVLDLCAAPGGKSFALAILMENSGELRSFDLHENRVRLITDGAARLGIDIITASPGDASRFDPALESWADAVLCDVPCSGLGTLSKKPDLRYKDIGSLDGLYSLQRAILENASRYVSPGGRLLYSTCTLSTRENGEVVEAFLERHPEYSLRDVRPLLPEPFREGIDTPDVTLLPHITGTDGFYMALMQKI